MPVYNDTVVLNKHALFSSSLSLLFLLGCHRTRCQITQQEGQAHDKIVSRSHLLCQQGTGCVSALHSVFSCRKRVPFPELRNAFSLLLNSSSALLMSPANVTMIWRFAPIQVVTNCGKLPDVTRNQPKIHPYGKDEPLNSEASSPISFSVLSRQRPHRGVS